MQYITHARTPEELLAEFTSDIRRRIDTLMLQHKYVANATEKTRIVRVIGEFQMMLDYWGDVTIQRPIRSRKRKPIQAIIPLDDPEE